MKIVVYFANGRNAKFDADKVLPVPASEMADLRKTLEEHPGAAVINRDSICFFCEVPEDKDDE